MAVSINGTTGIFMPSIELVGNSAGTGKVILTAPETNSTTTMVLPNNDGTLGFSGVPRFGSIKEAPYILTVSDVGQLIEVGSGGSITIPDATFATGDIVSIFNNTSGNITITCSITTAYISGIDADDASVTLLTRGLCSVLFVSGTVCVITGSVVP